MFTNKAVLDTLRTISYTSISSSFAVVGSSQLYPSRLICFTNTTDVNVIFSMDGATNQVIVPAGGFKLFDITTNHRPINQDDFCFATGTQWYVKEESASPSKGAVYIEIVYAQQH